MLKTKHILLLLIATIMIGSCKKDEEPVFSPIPFIRIDEVQPITTPEYENPLIIDLYYEDGDGDLGFSNPDSMSIFVQDSRLPAPDEFQIFPLSPEEIELSIRGTIQIKLSSPFLLGNGTSENITYSIIIRDRAGNWSNEVTTPNIVVTK